MGCRKTNDVFWEAQHDVVDTKPIRVEAIAAVISQKPTTTQHNARHESATVLAFIFPIHQLNKQSHQLSFLSTTTWTE